MTAQVFQCPSCGAPLLLKGSTAVIRCPHCLNSVIVPEELRRVSGSTAWTTLLYDNFASNDNDWSVGSPIDEYFARLNRVIANGRYRWEAQTSQPSSMAIAWLKGYQVSDFHLIVNAKHICGSRANSAWGLIFRVQDNHNHYWFRMTDNLFFKVSMVKNGEWLGLVEWTRTDTIKPNGVNQLEVIAQDAHFVFLINGQIVSKIHDDHFSRGMAGVGMEGFTEGEKTMFDFLDFTLRGQSDETWK
jgi:DNA-directed RNA polymerase subunit RPC12/RpoP